MNRLFHILLLIFSLSAKISVAQYFLYESAIYNELHFENEKLKTIISKNSFSKITEVSAAFKPFKKDSLSNNDRKGFYQIEALAKLKENDYGGALKSLYYSKESALANDSIYTLIDHAILSVIRYKTNNFEGATSLLSKIKWKNDKLNLLTRQLINDISLKTKDYSYATTSLNFTANNLKEQSELDQFHHYILSGLIFKEKKDYINSINAFTKSKKLMENYSINTLKRFNDIIYLDKFLLKSFHDSLYQAILYQIGFLYKEQGNNIEAKSYCYKLLKMPQISDYFSFKTYELLGVIHTLEKNYPTADEFYIQALDQKAYVPKEEINSTELLLAKNKFLQQKYNTSISNSQNLINQSATSNRIKALAYHLLYQNYLSNNDLGSAQKQYQNYQYYKELSLKEEALKKTSFKSTSIEQQIKETTIESEVSNELRQEFELKNAFNETKKKESDLKLLVKEFELKANEALFQKLEKEKIEREISLLNQRLELERMSNANDRLQKNSILQKLRAQKKEKEVQDLKNKELLSKKQNEINELEIQSKKKQNTYLIYGLATSIFLILITGLLYFTNIRKNKIIHQQNIQLTDTNNQLEEKNVVIDAKNKLITDSIAYAKTIQESLLPFSSNFSKLFPSHYIIFKPKNIVSGDCYLVLEHEDYIYLSVIDCTGHGLAGAMISSVAIQQLERLILMHKTNLVGILTELQNYFITQLNDTGDMHLNGLDLSLLVINKKNRTMKYSGAKGSFFVYSQKELIKFETTKLSIGQKNIMNTVFTEYNYELKENDCIYLFTDGIIDQFDPTTKKRFGNKNFTKFMNDLVVQEYTAQKDFFEIFYSEITKLNQTDDITFLSVKI